MSLACVIGEKRLVDADEALWRRRLRRPRSCASRRAAPIGKALRVSSLRAAIADARVSFRRDRSLAEQRGVKDPTERCRGGDPNRDDDQRGDLADGSLSKCFCAGAMLIHDRGRYELDGCPNAHRQNEHIIHKAEHRNEIWEEVYRRKCVGHDDRRQCFRVPRRSRVPRCEKEGQSVAFDRAQARESAKARSRRSRSPT